MSARGTCFFLIVILVGCNPSQPKHTVTIGAAANLTDVFGRIGPQLEAETGIHPVFNFASTAQLARQIENSAPFDMIAAADSEHVAELERKGLIVPGTRAVYARGVLALWIPDAAKTGLNRIQDLASPTVRVIAIAKPDLAPYGQAAVDTLQSLGMWEKVQPKIVYAENISMAKQYGKSKNADAVFTAYSLVLHESGKVVRVDENLHQPLNQELGIVSKSPNVEAARKFAAFLLTGAGKSILASYGYEAPRP
jgi:molybdate transport system substrate-binding protein